LPQLPQLKLSDCESAQRPLQNAWPAGHWLAHDPCEQSWPAPQALPHDPQLAVSLAVLTHLPPHPCEPFEQHMPPLHVIPSPHAVPHDPQLAGSV
jgi:hypothetical protein